MTSTVGVYIDENRVLHQPSVGLGIEGFLSSLTRFHEKSSFPQALAIFAGFSCCFLFCSNDRLIHLIGGILKRSLLHP